MPSSRDVETAVKNLLADMKLRAQSLEELRETFQMECLVKQIALPILDNDTPPSMVPAIARATLLGAWVQHDKDRILAERQKHAA